MWQNLEFKSLLYSRLKSSYEYASTSLRASSCTHIKSSFATNKAHDDPQQHMQACKLGGGMLILASVCGNFKIKVKRRCNP